MTGRRCEWRDLDSDRTCGSQTNYCVARDRDYDDRNYDSQDSCARHLARTVTALIGHENRPVIVTAIRDGAP